MTHKKTMSDARRIIFNIVIFKAFNYGMKESIKCIPSLGTGIGFPYSRVLG